MDLVCVCVLCVYVDVFVFREANSGYTRGGGHPIGPPQLLTTTVTYERFTLSNEREADAVRRSVVPSVSGLSPMCFACRHACFPVVQHFRGPIVAAADRKTRAGARVAPVRTLRCHEMTIIAKAFFAVERRHQGHF